jgi:hypothetical protein
MKSSKPKDLFGGGTFADDKAWQVVTTEGVTAKLKRVVGENSLCLDYNFNGKSGHIIIRRAVSLRLPANYALTFGVSGKSPRNTLEVKWIDPSGDNVWWVRRPNFRFCKQAVVLTSKARHFTYAWGPSRDKLTDVAFVELVITASEGGKGTVRYDDMRFAEMPVPEAYALPATVLDNWSVKDDGKRREVVIDLGADREFGGLTIDWTPGRHARKFSVQMRADGTDETAWQSLATAAMNLEKRTFVYAPECEARYLRIVMDSSDKKKGYGIDSVTLQPLSFSESKSAFLAAVAKTVPRGFFPRHLLGEMSYWTVTGVYGDSKKALINEEGMVEAEKLGFSLEPFILESGNRLLTWADGTHTHSLANGSLPMPIVTRRHDDGLALTVKPFAYGPPGKSVLYIEYVLKNESSARKRGRLALTVRPFQVNPPWQFLNSPGGFSPITGMSWKTDRLLVDNGSNGKKEVRLVETSDGLGPKAGIKVGVTNFFRGTIGQWLTRGKPPSRQRIHDALGFASGMIVKHYDLAPEKELKVVLAVPMHDNGSPTENTVHAWDMALAYWRGKMLRVGSLKLPGKAQAIADTLKAQLGYILANRNGVAIQPGTRCYDRSWARDGALTSAALLQFGYVQEARQFIEWFGSYQFDNGKIPCVVDHRGADPTPEHDSHGEFIFMVAEYYRFTRDREFLQAQFPRVLKAVDFIQQLLGENTREEPHLKGILPPSISHEGYSDKPAYSLWDGFFCLKGLEDAVFLSEELHKAPFMVASAEARDLVSVTTGLQAKRDAYKTAFYAAVRASMALHGIDYLPGSCDRGDFDATSTTIALDPGGQLLAMREEFCRTFDKWWRYFLERRGGQVEWDGYTPYEVRAIGAFVRLGQRARAHEALEWFLTHRRPSGWLHWGEVVHRDPLTPKFVGDMPHGWVGSDYVRSLRSCLVYEREDGTVVIGAGIKYDWLFEPGELTFELPTHHGTIVFHGQRSGYRYKINISGTCTAPMVLQLPYFAKSVTVDGRPGTMEIKIDKLPAEVVVDLD